MDEAVERVAIAVVDGWFEGMEDWRALDDTVKMRARFAARAALLAAVPIIAEEMAREVEARPFHSDYPYDVETCTRTAQAIRSHAQHLVGKG